MDKIKYGAILLGFLALGLVLGQIGGQCLSAQAFEVGRQIAIIKAAR